MRNAARSRVAMIPRILRGLNQLVDDHARRSAIGIAHAEIDYILPRSTRSRLHLIDDGENVGRQLLDAIKRIGGISHPLILRVKLPATPVYASRRPQTLLAWQRSRSTNCGFRWLARQTRKASARLPA